MVNFADFRADRARPIHSAQSIFVAHFLQMARWRWRARLLIAGSFPVWFEAGAIQALMRR
jgi:hypothetical protein